VDAASACQAHNRNRIVAGSNPARPTSHFELLFVLKEKKGISAKELTLICSVEHRI
jgi:hypothetical protein